MSKAVLVMDMPENCQKCPCFFGGTCFAIGKVETSEDIDPVMTVEEACAGSPDWCPLRELPKRKELQKTKSEVEFATFTGWNLCMTAITGGIK